MLEGARTSAMSMQQICSAATAVTLSRTSTRNAKGRGMMHYVPRINIISRLQLLYTGTTFVVPRRDRRNMAWYPPQRAHTVRRRKQKLLRDRRTHNKLWNPVERPPPTFTWENNDRTKRNLSSCACVCGRMRVS